MEFLDDVVDTAVDSFFDRASDFVERIRDSQRQALTEEQLRQTFKCAGCHQLFRGDSEQIEMVHRTNGFCTCKHCFSFMWTAAKEKVSRLSKRAARSNAHRAAAGGAAPPPPTEKPWELLGIDIHASAAEIKKAYKRMALQWHPDRWSGASQQQKAHADEMFKKVTWAKDVMMKVRQPPEG